jgi:hypothetical protein
MSLNLQDILIPCNNNKKKVKRNYVCSLFFPAYHVTFQSVLSVKVLKIGVNINFNRGCVRLLKNIVTLLS